MKIHFDNVRWDSLSGPNTFANRLARCLFESGHEVVLDGIDADVSLVFIERTGKPLAKKVVQRLDGIWFKPDEFETKNVGIKHLYTNANAVVFQSFFDKEMITRFWGKSDNVVVINNGIDLTPVKEISIPKLAEMRAQYDRIYVCSSNWHLQKRLKSNVELFERLRRWTPNSCLIVLGKDPDYVTMGPHVFYSGPVGPDVYMQVYAAADWMLHLAWADHCPNVVIEALSQGTPVVCSSVGGTKELVGSYGFVLKEDREYNYELYDYDHPPTINVDDVCDLVPRSELDYSSIADIDINHVTQRYVELFERLL